MILACFEFFSFSSNREIITGGIDGELHLYPGIYEDESAITNCNEKIKSIDSQVMFETLEDFSKKIILEYHVIPAFCFTKTSKIFMCVY